MKDEEEESRKRGDQFINRFDKYVVGSHTQHQQAAQHDEKAARAAQLKIVCIICKVSYWCCCYRCRCVGVTLHSSSSPSVGTPVGLARVQDAL